jgi:FAD/FMN-containing dehydrogenase
MQPSLAALIFSSLLVFVQGDNISQFTICHELVSALSGQVFFPEAPVYNASISSYPFLQLRLHPNCIVRPKSAQDVSLAIGILKESNTTRFAVKGGGHNANAGYNNIDNGVTIDMQSMKDVEVARGDQVVRVEAGALSQDAYNAAEKRNLTVLVGRIGVVGTAGFLTGGTMFPQLLYYHEAIADLRQVASRSSHRNSVGPATQS